MTKIYYNNFDVFSGLGPTPLIGRQEQRIYVGEYLGTKDVWTLNGNITGNCLSFSGNIDLVNTLLTRFNKDYQIFEIQESGAVVYSKFFSEIDQIIFPTNNFASKVIPYEITISCYPSGLFSGVFGVLEPNNEWVFQEQNDGIVNITHTISARGFNASPSNSSALDNAKNWVWARTGWNQQIYPAFINTGNFTPCLQTVAERLSRLDGTYSIVETYSTDPCSSGIGILKFTTDYDYDFDRGISRVNLNGNLIGCKDAPLTGLRARYSNFDAFGEALTTYWKVTNLTDLNYIPLSKGVSENTTASKINFSYSWDNDKTPITFFDYKIKFDYDYENDIIAGSIDGVLRSRAPIENRWTAMKLIADQIDLYSLILPYYLDYANSINPSFSSFPLNPVFNSRRQSYNEFASEISLGASFSNEPLAPNGLKDFDYSLNFTPALKTFISQPVLNGTGVYIVYDMGYVRRARCELQVQGIGQDNQTPVDVENILKNQISFLRAQYFTGTRIHLESQNLNKNNASFNKSISISAAFSAEQSYFTF